MFDYLDMETIKDTDYLEGNYYEKKPKKPEDNPVYFEYEMIDEKSRAYALIMGNMKSDNQTCAIKTDYALNWRINGYVVTQDGTLWTVSEVRKIVQIPENKEALRIVRQTNNTEYLIRLLIADNPWGLK